MSVKETADLRHNIPIGQPVVSGLGTESLTTIPFIMKVCGTPFRINGILGQVPQASSDPFGPVVLSKFSGNSTSSIVALMTEII